MLDYFRNDKAVGAICGFYSNELEYKPSASFFFSRYLRVWGWAGWRRSIEGYDSDINLLIEKQNTWKKDIFSRTDIFLKRYWQDMFEEVRRKIIDTWDIQLQYLLWQKKTARYCSIKKSYPKYRLGSGGSCVDKRSQSRISNQ
jgi:hypothetical protein